MRSGLWVILFAVGYSHSVIAAELDTRESVEAAVARLSDTEVREMLLAQLGVAPASEITREEFNPAVIAYRLQRDVGRLSDELSAIFASVGELPEVFPRAWAKFSADRQQGGLLWFVIALVISMGAGGALAMLLRSQVTPGLRNIDLRQPDSCSGKLAVLLWRLGLHMAYIATFALVSLTVFVLFFDESPKDRTAFLFYLAASVIFLLAIAFSLAVHSPKRAALRLSLYTDDQAKKLHNTVMLTVGFGAFAFFTCALMGTLGVLGHVHQLFLILVGVLTAALLVLTILSSRSAISTDLASHRPLESVRGIFSRVWPWLFAVSVPILLSGLIVRELLYDFVPYGAALATIGLMAVVPSFDALLFRESQRLMDNQRDVKAATVRGARFALLFLVVAVFCAVWRINPLAVGSGGVGAQIANAVLQISLTLLVIYGAWQFVRITVDRKIAEEDAELAEQGVDQSEAEVGGTGLSRMRTLLPLFKRSLQASIFVIGIMIILASLGIDIAPLLAGAGVIGLAVGFGSQTLVKDIVSGAFFLLDDAFRIGEYIDVGSVKGSVEKMSVRSVRLRHHRGAVHTVPFGEVKTLTNYSRDWAIMKLKFRVPFDTDVDKVRKLLKKTGLALAENPDIKDDFIQPFKSQGATEADDYGFVITTKFMSKPGKQFVIRRYAFAAVQKAFEENGIEFATPKVEVTVEEEQSGDAQTAGSDERRTAIGGAGAGHAVSLVDPPPA